MPTIVADTKFAAAARLRLGYAAGHGGFWLDVKPADLASLDGTSVRRENAARVLTTSGSLRATRWRSGCVSINWRC